MKRLRGPMTIIRQRAGRRNGKLLSVQACSVRLRAPGRALPGRIGAHRLHVLDGTWKVTAPTRAASRIALGKKLPAEIDPTCELSEPKLTESAERHPLARRRVRVDRRPTDGTDEPHKNDSLAQLCRRAITLQVTSPALGLDSSSRVVAGLSVPGHSASSIKQPLTSSGRAKQFREGI